MATGSALWRHITDVSSRQLTNALDVLNAVLGVLEKPPIRIAPKVPFYHIQGIPFGAASSSTISPLLSFAHCLLWTSGQAVTRKVKYPSWTWASWDRDIHIIQPHSPLEREAATVGVEFATEPKHISNLEEAVSNPIAYSTQIHRIIAGDAKVLLICAKTLWVGLRDSPPTQSKAGMVRNQLYLYVPGYSKDTSYCLPFNILNAQVRNPAFWSRFRPGDLLAVGVSRNSMIGVENGHLDNPIPGSDNSSFTGDGRGVVLLVVAPVNGKLEPWERIGSCDLQDLRPLEESNDWVNTWRKWKELTWQKRTVRLG